MWPLTKTGPTHSEGRAVLLTALFSVPFLFAEAASAVNAVKWLNYDMCALYFSVTVYILLHIEAFSRSIFMLLVK